MMMMMMTMMMQDCADTLNRAFYKCPIGRFAAPAYAFLGS